MPGAAIVSSQSNTAFDAQRRKPWSSFCRNDQNLKKSHIHFLIHMPSAATTCQVSGFLLLQFDTRLCTVFLDTHRLSEADKILREIHIPVRQLAVPCEVPKSAAYTPSLSVHIHTVKLRIEVPGVYPYNWIRSPACMRGRGLTGARFVTEFYGNHYWHVRVYLLWLYIRLFVTKTDYNTTKIQINRQTDRQTNKHYN